MKLRLAKFFEKINWNWVAIIMIAIVAIFTRFYQLAAIPAPWHLDEAGMAYDAFALAGWRVNRNMMHLPVYLPNYSDGQSALYAYLTAGWVMIFGDITPWVARLTGALFSLAAIFFGALFIKKALGKKSALLAAGLLTIFPYFIMQGRYGLDCNLFLGASIISLYVTLVALKSEKYRYYLIAGLSWGITLYSYALSWVVVPAFLFLLFVYLLMVKKIHWRKILCLWLAVLAVAWPLIIFVAIEALDLPPVYSRFFYIPRLMNNRADSFQFLNLVNFLKLPRLLFFVRDGEAYLPYPSFYWLSAPFALSGLFLSFKNCGAKLKVKKFSAHALIVLFFIANLILISISSVNSNDTHHLNSIFWPLAFFIIYGLVYFYRQLKKIRAKQIYLGLLIFLYTGAFGIFIYQYLVIFPRVPTYQKSFMYIPTPDVALAELAKYAQEKQIEDLVAQRQIWLDIPRYIYYYLGARTSPVEVDLSKDIMNEVRFGNLHFTFMPGRAECAATAFCPVEIEERDIYLVNSREHDYHQQLLDLGFQEIWHDDAYWLMLKEDEFLN